MVDESNDTVRAKVVSLTSDLVKCSTPSGEDAGGQELLAQRLEALGFAIQSISAGGRKHLLALRGAGPKFLAFAGHTDVVPAGEGWSSPPFEAFSRDGSLYGRGVADMKGAVAAFVVALEKIIGLDRDFPVPLAVLIAGDEETDSVGTPALLQSMTHRGLSIESCLVGEPSATEVLGDCVKVGRRGSLSAVIEVQGIQGHVAYPHLARNPIHDMVKVLAELQEFDFDWSIEDIRDGTHDIGWPKTSLQMTLIVGGVESATNVIPGTATTRFNIRFRPPHTRDSLIKVVNEFFSKAEVPYVAKWASGCIPYDSTPGTWRDTVCAAIQSVCGRSPVLSRDGGTSDGRFIAQHGAQVMEVGPCNATIHKVDEHLKIADLELLVVLYADILVRYRNSRDTLNNSLC